MLFFFFFSSRRRHTRWPRDWSSDVCSSDLVAAGAPIEVEHEQALRPHQPLAEQLLDVHRAGLMERIVVERALPPERFLVQAAPDVGEALDQRMEHVLPDPYELDVVDRRARGRAGCAE